GSFLSAVTELRDAHYERLAEKARRKSEGKPANLGADARHGEAHDAQWYVNENLAYAQACPSPYMAWAVLKPVRSWIGELPEGRRVEAYRALTARYERLEHSPLSYAARYERAACYGEILQCASGPEREAAGDEARRLFTQLFRETVSAGQIPALDARFF